MNHSYPDSLTAVAAALVLATALPAQVIECHAFKGAVYFQTVANSIPASPDAWSAGILLVTTSAGDAAQVTLSGGNIPGSLDLVHEGNGIWYTEDDFGDQAAMNAVFPSNATYTLAMSGGTLGTLVQSFTFGIEQYPNLPYLTGSSFATAVQFPAVAGATLTVSDPGPLTRASGLTVVEIADRSGGQVWSSWSSGAVTSLAVPANAIGVDDCYVGWLEYTSTTPSVSGAFGVPVQMHHSRGTDFEIRSWSHPTPPCAWHQVRGDACSNLNLSSNDPILGRTWDLSTSGVPVGGLAITVFAFGPQEPGLPLSVFGINAPGCLVHVDTFSSVANVSGVVLGGPFDVAIALPPHSFGNVVFYVQTVTMAPQLLGGMATSNVVEAFVGS